MWESSMDFILGLNFILERSFAVWFVWISLPVGVLWDVDPWEDSASMVFSSELLLSVRWRVFWPVIYRVLLQDSAHCFECGVRVHVEKEKGSRFAMPNLTCWLYPSSRPIIDSLVGALTGSLRDTDVEGRWTFGKTLPLCTCLSISIRHNFAVELSFQGYGTAPGAVTQT